MVVNRQRVVSLNVPAVRGFVRRLKRELRIERWDFDVAFVDDSEIARLNSVFRGKPGGTDVLSFPWRDGRPKGEAQLLGGNSAIEKRLSNPRPPPRELAGFLGDIIISMPAARRNARREGHPVTNEIRWLILHGALHLLGYDHEKDSGEMTAAEIDLRARLRIDGSQSLSRRITGRSGAAVRALSGAGR